MKEIIENKDEIKEWLETNLPDNKNQYSDTIITSRSRDMRYEIKIFKNSIFIQKGSLDVINVKDKNHILYLEFIKYQEEQIFALSKKIKELKENYKNIDDKKLRKFKLKKLLDEKV